MNLDLYSDRAKQAVQSAQSLALARRHQQFAPEHLLKVLLEERDGLARNLITAAGGDPAKAEVATETALKKRAQVTGGNGQIYLDGDTARVRTGDREWETPLVVVAAGSWVEQVAGGSLPLPPFLVEADQPSHFRPRDPAAVWPSFLHHSPDAAGPAGLGFAAYGLETPGTGVKVGGYDTVAPTDPDRRTPPDPARTARLVEYVEEWFPGLDPEPFGTTSCLFTSTADEHFVLDRRGPLVVCSPCSGHGFKFVPAIGDVVVDLADGRVADPAWRLP